MSLTIVGLGPGPKEDLTMRAQTAIRQAQRLFVQTERHPLYPYLCEQNAWVETVDSAYEQAEDFDALNETIARRVLDAARTAHTVWAAAGHGLQGQAASQAILQLAKQEGVKVDVVPGLSADAAALAASGVDACAGVNVHVGEVDALRVDGSRTQIITELDTPLRAGQAKIALMQVYGDEHPVYWVCLVDNTMQAVPILLCELDRQMNYDITCSVVIPGRPLLQRDRFQTADLLEICRILRAPDGCPWDREQTHFSLKSSLLEECCEVLAAIDEGDSDHVCEELGDVLLNLALHATIGAEQGEYTMEDITTGICTKMIRRHPHIFSDVQADTSEQVLQNWEAIKAQERGDERQAPKPLLQGVGEGMPALIRAQKLQQKARKIGFDWEDYRPAMHKVREELDELTQEMEGQGLHTEEEAGDLLFAAVNVARLCGVHAETALMRACEKFQSRIHAMERLALLQGNELKTLSLQEQDALWEKIKKENKRK